MDKFKFINDNFGHREGDKILKTISKIIKSSFKRIGLCYRIGGDEFCILSLNTSKSVINSCIDAVNESLNKERCENKKIPTVSIGYSIFKKKNGKTLSDSLDEADLNMYYNKNYSKK